MDPPPRRSGWAPSQISSWSQLRSSAVRSSIRSVMPGGGEQSRQNSPEPSRSSSSISESSNDFGRNDEAGLPVQPHRPGMPKSKTFNVFSSITQSFSNSRNVSTSTRHRSQTPAPDPPPHKPSPPVKRESLEPLLAESRSYRQPTSEPRASHAPLPDNLRLVRTAMPPEYWAGRFISLHDKFHNELLMSQNLDVILEVHSARFLLQGNGAFSSTAAAQNNPSASAYSVRRIAAPTFMSSGLNPSQEKRSTNQSQSRIPQSATSGAILQTTPHCSSRASPRTYTPYTHSNNPRSRPPSYDQGNIKVSSRPPSTYDHGNTTLPIMLTSEQDVPPEVPKHRKALANNLEDDEARCKRVFVHLEAFCVTEEARESLKRWQAVYARKTRMSALLPV
ncbi:hypothetical protein QBC43DRAFT_214321, partial [Cladorrhinum sp. PSN259]